MKLFERFKKIFNRNNDDEFIKIGNEDKEENTELLADEEDIFDIDEIYENTIKTTQEDNYQTYREEVETKNSLLEDWYWIFYEDGSGSLMSPTGNSYFSFDWCTREYMEKSGEHYSYFGYRDDDGNPLTFKDFKIYAEEYTIEKYVKLPENKKMEIEQEDEEEM